MYIYIYMYYIYTYMIYAYIRAIQFELASSDPRLNPLQQKLKLLRRLWVFWLASFTGLPSMHSYLSTIVIFI